MDSLCKVRLNFGWSIRIPASGGLQRPSKAGRGRKFFFGSNDSFWPKRQSLMVPDGVRPSRTLQRPQGCQRPAKAKFFFWLKWFLLTSESIPDGPWWCAAPQDPPAASRPSKAGQGRNFFLARTVPFHLHVDPWWSLTVSVTFLVLSLLLNNFRALQSVYK